MITHPADPAEPVPFRRRVARVGWPAWVGLGLVLAAVAYSIVWFQVATQFRGGIERWAAAQRADGLEIGFERLRIEGFPFAWRARIEAPLVQATRAAEGGRRLAWRWRPDQVTLAVRPWRPGTWVMDAPGAHAIEMVLPHGVQRITGELGVLEAGYTDGAAGGRLVVRAANAAGIAEPGGEFAVGSLTFDGRLPRQAAPADHLTVTAEAALDAAAVRLPGAASPLADTVERARIAFQVMGPVAPPYDARALADWRDDGGTLEVTALGVTHGALGVDASGTLALDADMQPIGAFTARVQGFLQAVDALQAAGAIAPSDAVTARIVLSALARRDGSGAASLSVPVQIQAGILHAGPVPLMRLPRIEWPGIN